MEEIFGEGLVEDELCAVAELVGETIGKHNLEEEEENSAPLSVSISVQTGVLRITHLRARSSDDLERTAVLLQAFGEDFVASCGP